MWMMKSQSQLTFCVCDEVSTTDMHIEVFLDFDPVGPYWQRDSESSALDRAPPTNTLRADQPHEMLDLP